jgi:hypothetical protein
MATDPRKRQKQLAKKKAKRKVVTTQKIVAQLGGGFLSQTVLEKSPIHECFVAENIFEAGIGSVIIARQIPNGEIAVGFFMLDSWCLGIKNAFLADLTEDEYQQKLQDVRFNEEIQPVSPAYARKLVEDCGVYAKDLGFSPHPDYKKAKRVFGNIDPGECTESFKFGKDGKPYYVSGPYDTPEKTHKILKTLEKNCGTDNYHYLSQLGPFDDDDDDKQLEWKV